MPESFRTDDGKSDQPVAFGNAPHGGPLPVTEGYSTAVTITPNDTAPNPVVALGNAILVVATVAGNVKVALVDGSLVTFAVAVGNTLLPLRVSQVFVTGTTATATYYGLK